MDMMTKLISSDKVWDNMLPDYPFAPIDLHFAGFMTQMAGVTSRELALAAALVSRLGREGHTCVDLKSPVPSAVLEYDDRLKFEPPAPEDWIAALRALSVVGWPGDYRPLILDSAGRLYLHRSYENERVLARKLLEMNSQERPFNTELFCDGLIRMFPDQGEDGNIAQKTAALIAVSRSLCVITGGPGTGKTTLVCRILALLLEQEPGLNIALAAPTGKAASRIVESVRRGIGMLGCSPEVARKIPCQASTIHRLLGFSSGSSRPRHHSDNPLSADVVVVDEASMADLELMSLLARALRPISRLILIGDRNQLASVAAGYVLGDICDTGRTHAYSQGFADTLMQTTGYAVPCSGTLLMQDSLVELTRTYRFSEGSPISALSAAVNAGDHERCTNILLSNVDPGLVFKELPPPAGFRGRLGDAVLKGYEEYLGSKDALERFILFDSFRILSPVRQGPYGVKALNRMVEETLREAGMLDISEVHYHLRPVLITENDYTLQLYNGDIGLILVEDGELRACFLGSDGAIRKISPMRLPAHETAWAMTVHKSQGSEFGNVLFIMPHRDSPVLTRELVYTSITRARHSIEIWSDTGILSRAVARRTMRSSGLNEMLWGSESAG